MIMKNKEYQTECFVKRLSLYGKEGCRVEFEPSKEWSVELENKKYFVLKEKAAGEEVGGVLMESLAWEEDNLIRPLMANLVLAKINKARICVSVELDGNKALGKDAAGADNATEDAKREGKSSDATETRGLNESGICVTKVELI